MCSKAVLNFPFHFPQSCGGGLKRALVSQRQLNVRPSAAESFPDHGGNTRNAGRSTDHILLRPLLNRSLEIPALSPQLFKELIRSLFLVPRWSFFDLDRTGLTGSIMSISSSCNGLISNNQSYCPTSRKCQANTFRQARMDFSGSVKGMGMAVPQWAQQI